VCFIQRCLVAIKRTSNRRYTRAVRSSLTFTLDQICPGRSLLSGKACLPLSFEAERAKSTTPTGGKLASAQQRLPPHIFSQFFGPEGFVTVPVHTLIPACETTPQAGYRGTGEPASLV
jgi:hypothetical protein